MSNQDAGDKDACISSLRGRLVACFDECDVDGNGHIKKDDLVQLLSELGLSQAQVCSVLDSLGLGEKGFGEISSIEYRKFIYWCYGPPPPTPALPPVAVGIAVVQQTWREGLMKIGAAARDGGDLTAAAADFVERHYAFQSGPVVFKPSVASDRIASSADAIKYFANPLLQLVIEIHLENALVITKGPYMFVQGQSTFNSITGISVVSDYTFGYEREAHGFTKLFLHLSSAAATSREKVEGNGELENMHQLDCLDEISSVQQAWANGLLKIAETARGESEGASAVQAEHFVDVFYSRQDDNVLFKTTSSTGEVCFAERRQDVVGYFGNGALQSLTGIRFENSRIFTKGTLLFAQGVLHASAGAVVNTSGYIFGYERNAAGQLCIFLHHSFAPLLFVEEEVC